MTWQAQPPEPSNPPPITAGERLSILKPLKLRALQQVCSSMIWGQLVEFNAFGPYLLSPVVK